MDPNQPDPMDITNEPGNYQGMSGQDDSNHSTPNYHHRPATSQSADFPPSATYSPHMDTNSPNMGYPQGMPTSRPPSGLSDGTTRQGSGYDQSSRSTIVQEKAQNSVVIKVGMVGDAQIGKTSLMVKYVEGSWDEDYIQTLGKELEPSKEIIR